MMKWRRFSVLLCILLLVTPCIVRAENLPHKPITLLHASIRCERTLLDFDIPEGWHYVIRENANQTAADFSLSQEQLEQLFTDASDVLLLYPQEGRFDLQHYLKLAFKPMESYHRDFTAMTDEQLGNVGQSYMKELGSSYDQWALYRPNTGLTFLKLTLNDSSDLAYVTNENGVRVTIEVHGTRSSELEQTITAFLDHFIIGEPGVDWAAWLSKYGAFIGIPATALLTILWKEHRKRKAKQ